MTRFTTIDIRLALRALAVFLVLMAVFVPSFLIQQREERDLRITRERFTSAQVAERFSQFVSLRLKTLELLEYTRSTLASDDQYDVWSARIERKIKGFFAINWVDSHGVITSIMPLERNAKALGHNLLTRDETSPYLTLSRDERRPVMSHVIELYQGPQGIVLYLPIFDEQGFKGWINGVLSTAEFMPNLVPKGEFESSYLSLHFLGHNEPTITHGELKPGWEPVAYVFQILNQNVEIQLVPYGVGASDHISQRWSWIVFGLVIATSIILSVFAYLVMFSRQRLAQRLEKERLHGVLLNLLVHDIINPLMIVRFGAETAQRMASETIQPALDKVLYGVTQINDVISRVKDMRAIEAGRFVAKTTSVAVNDLIDDSKRLFEQRLAAKNLKSCFAHSPENPKILIDRVIFQNNVLNNILSNAVKFSEEGSKVTLRCAGVLGKFVVIEVEDEGVGMSEAIRANLFLDNVDVSRPGTLGEKGTGIGMLQVKTYMKMFGGQVSVESKVRVSGSANHGSKFRLMIPVAR